MSNQKKILAIIPARSGSKGLKDKNIKDLNGKPLIAHTIEAAKKSGVFHDIIVSTDSLEYADIAKQYGAEVPFLRPVELSTDTATSTDVISYTIKQLGLRGRDYEYFMLLQPTSPLRDSIDIKSAVDLLFEKDANSIVSVCESEYSPMLMNTLDENLCTDNFLNVTSNKRRQELPQYYRVNGAIYLSNVNFYKVHQTFYKEKSYAYVMDTKKSIDIDSIVDFEVARILMDDA